MTLLDEVTLYWSEQVTRDIAKETILAVDSKKDVFYDYDNCLNSNWEGFCVYVQEEVTVIDLEAYMKEIDSHFLSYYKLLPKEEQFTVWLQTQKGKAWIENQQFHEVAPVEYVDCKELLMNVFTQMASTFQSDGIMRYVKYVIRGEEVEEDDFEEEEEEYED